MSFFVIKTALKEINAMLATNPTNTPTVIIAKGDFPFPVLFFIRSPSKT